MPVNFLENTEEEPFFERPQVKAIFQVLLGVGFVCFVLVMSNYNRQIKNLLDDYTKEELNGIVTIKTRETKPRYEWYVVVHNKKHFLYTPLIDNISIGDSVSKIKNATYTQIFKKDTVITIYNKDIQKYYIDANAHN